MYIKENNIQDGDIMSKNYALPEIKNVGELELLHFPTRMQAFVFRNWETIPAKQLAKVLGTTEDNVLSLAKNMGLQEQGDVSVWKKQGYITIIKQNWHILPYEQLLSLLEWTEEQLAYTLREDDFLFAKLGYFKPFCEKVEYKPLNAKQLEETRELRKNVEELLKKPSCAPFDFFPKESINPANAKLDGAILTNEWGIVDNTDFSRIDTFIGHFMRDMKERFGLSLCGNEKFITIEKCDGTEESHTVSVTEEGISIKAADSVGVLRALLWLLDKMEESGSPCVPFGTTERTARFKNRIIYSYHGLYGNVFDEDIELSFTDKMLYRYAKLGINAVWTQGVLYKLCEFPFDKALSAGYEERRNKLLELVKRAADYGIKVFLYINEPRAMPHSFFEKYPHLKGDSEGDYSALCTSTPEVKKYLYDAVQSLCKAVEGLGGFFTITASENLTNCHSRLFERETTCPRCKDRTPAEVYTEVNKIIYEAATSVSPSIRVIAWSWGWNRMYGYNGVDEDYISALPKGISVMNVSEEAIPFHIAGVEDEVLDYSMSIVGPGERAKKIWSLASKHGCDTAAKVQINNTWECSTVPYIPVFGLLCQHIENLLKLSVNDLLLSWTLGGAPSPNIKMASQYFFAENGEKTDMLCSLYGDNASLVKKATEHFDRAFKEFPFHIDTIYFGPQFLGPAGLLFKEKSGFLATMTGFSYDDVEKWCGPYTAAALEEQFLKLSCEWEKGLSLLEPMKNSEIYDVSAACYAIFRSCYNQIKYVRLRESVNKKEILALLREEEKLSQILYEITLRRATVGYEASNHYVYTPQICLERILNCRRLIKEFI